MMDAKDRILEKEGWDNIINSNGWFVLLDLIDERQAKLQKEVNRAVKDNDITTAGKALAIIGEYDKLLSHAQERYKNYNKELKDD